MHSVAKVLGVTTLALSLALPTFAAAPDGAGPWADSVASSSQGLRKDGSPVLPARSNPSSALGVAENNTADGSFFSLGFAGSMVLQFDNPISDGVVLVEATNLPYASETALIELSADGSTWLTAGTVVADDVVAMPERLSCARFVRITDTSNKANAGFPPEADGYDVDGVRAVEGVPCETPNVPEFGTVTAGLATLMSGGVFMAIKRKFGMS